MIVVSLHLPFFMTTESCTSTSQMTTWNVRALCPNLKNNNEHFTVDSWRASSTSAPEWTRQAWMGFPLVSCLMDACTFESALMQHLKWTSGSVDTTKATLAFSQCHTSCNVTIYKRNPLRVVLKAGMPESRKAGMPECRKSRPGNPKTRNDWYFSSL